MTDAVKTTEATPGETQRGSRMGGLRAALERERPLENEFTVLASVARGSTNVNRVLADRKDLITGSNGVSSGGVMHRAGSYGSLAYPPHPAGGSPRSQSMLVSSASLPLAPKHEDAEELEGLVVTCMDRQQQGRNSNGNSQNNGVCGGLPPPPSSSGSLSSVDLPKVLVSSENGSNHREWGKETTEPFECQHVEEQNSFCSGEATDGSSHHNVMSGSHGRSYDSVAVAVGVKDDGDTLMPCVPSMTGRETIASSNGTQPSCHHTSRFLDGKTLSAAEVTMTDRGPYHELHPPLPVEQGTTQYSPQTLPHSLPHQQRFCSVTCSVSEGNSGGLVSSGLRAPSQRPEAIGGLVPMSLVTEAAYAQVGHFLPNGGSSHSQNAPFGVGYYGLSRASDQQQQQQQQPEESGCMRMESESPGAAVPVVYNGGVSHSRSGVAVHTHMGSECNMPPTSSQSTLTQSDQQDAASLLQQQPHIHPAHPATSGHHHSHALRQAPPPHHGALHMMHLGYAQTFGLGSSSETSVRTSIPEMMLPFTVAASSASSGSSTSASSRTPNLDVVGHGNEGPVDNATFVSGQRSDPSFGTFYYNNSTATQPGSQYTADAPSQRSERRHHSQHQEEVVVNIPETASDGAHEQRGEQQQPPPQQQLYASTPLPGSAATSGSQGFGSEGHEASGALTASSVATLPVKRRRGRPRKHPLPLSSSGSLSVDRTVTASSSLPLRGIDGRRGGTPASQGSGDRLSGGRVLNGSQEHGAVERNRLCESENRSGKCLGIDRVKQHLWALRGLREAYCSQARRHLESDAIPSHYQKHEVAEEYVGIGGPFTAMAIAVQLQEVQDRVIERELGWYGSGSGAASHSTAVKKTSASTSGEHEGVSLRKETESVMLDDCLDLQKTFKEALQPEALAINLNSSFAWSSFDPKIPVRELAVARHHLAALLNDSRVFVYRHRTHPLVRSRVNEWEHVEPLQDCGIVAIRIASGNLPPNWRQLYHERNRISLLREIHQGLSKGKRLSANTVEGYGHISVADLEKLVTEQPSIRDLEQLAMEHPSGILCCSSSLLDPDWLPEPFVLAALDQSGIVRIAKCSGYFNYPIVVKTGIAIETQCTEKPNGTNPVDAVPGPSHSGEPHGPSSLQAVPSAGSTLCHTRSTATAMQRVSGDTAGGESEGNVTGPQPTPPLGGHVDAVSGHPRVLFRIERNPLRIDRIERQPELFIPTKEVNDAGQAVKVRAQVQDVALAELTLDSLLAVRPSGGLEVAMVFYALGNNEHSAFVKGKNLYIRFKNFPTGPAKVHCGPLGHSGAVLLANGTVWSWMAQPKTVGNNNGKLGVLIQQVGGSLEGKVVVDFMAIGADFLALTSDGVVHEWNCYTPYLANPLCTNFCALTIPQSLLRPNIPEPIELTPDFQKKLLGRVHSVHHKPFKVGQFRWFGSPSTTENGATREETVNCSGSATDRNVNESTVAKGGDGESQQFERVMPPSSTILPHNNVDDGAGTPVVSESRHREENQQQYPFVVGPKTVSEVNDRDRGENGDAREVQETKTAAERKIKSSDTWELSDYWSEEALERHRQKEIKQLYFSSSANDSTLEVPDPIERIFFLEGITFFFRGTSNSFSYVTNTLGDYHSGTAHPCWSGSFGAPQTFNAVHANYFLRTFGNLGKPFLTNPVVVARMKLPPDLTNEQLRQQLEMMAVARLPPYRLLLSPTSLCVGVLRCWDVAEEGRRLASALPGPLSLLACHPERYLEILSGLRKELLHSPVPEGEDEMIGGLGGKWQGIKRDTHGEQPNRQQSEAKNINNGGAQGNRTENTIALEHCADNHMSRRSTGTVRRGNRVGRPRGSRLGLRGVFTSQRALASLRRSTLSTAGELEMKESPSQQDERSCPENFESPLLEKTWRSTYESHCSSSTCVATSLESVTHNAVRENAMVEKDTPQSQSATTIKTVEPDSPKTDVGCEGGDRGLSEKEVTEGVNHFKEVLRKRPRRHSSAAEDDRFFTDFVDGEESDKAWEQMLQLMDDETAEIPADNPDGQQESVGDVSGSTRRRRRRCGSYGPRNFGTRGRRRGRGSSSQVTGHNRAEKAVSRAGDISTPRSEDASFLQDSPTSGLQNASEPEEIDRGGLQKLKKAEVNKLMASRGRVNSLLGKARGLGRRGRKAYKARFRATDIADEGGHGSSSLSDDVIDEVNASLEKVSRRALPWNSGGQEAAGEESCAELNRDIRTVENSGSDKGSGGGLACLLHPLEGRKGDGNQQAIHERNYDTQEGTFFVHEGRDLSGFIKKEALNGVVHTEYGGRTGASVAGRTTRFASSTDCAATAVKEDSVSMSVGATSIPDFGESHGAAVANNDALNGHRSISGSESGSLLGDEPWQPIEGNASFKTEDNRSC